MDTAVSGRLNHNTFSNNQIGLEVAIIAGTSIPVDTTTLPFVSKLSFGRIFDSKPVNHYLMAFLSQSGTLCVDQHLDWIPFVRIARNCFEQNLTAILSHNNSAIVLKTIKSIAKGEELLVWPSSELMGVMNIPFLIPPNIINDHCYQCHRCGQSFTQPNPLKIHLILECSSLKPSIDQNCGQIVEQNSLKDYSLEKQENKAIPGLRAHTCRYCGKNYTRKYGLKIHERTHTGQKPLRCSFCGRPFSDPSNLNKHIRLHSQNNTSIHSNPYKCKLCSKVLIRRRDLERHIKSRHQSI